MTDTLTLTSLDLLSDAVLTIARAYCAKVRADNPGEAQQAWGYWSDKYINEVINALFDSGFIDAESTNALKARYPLWGAMKENRGKREGETAND